MKRRTTVALLLLTGLLLLFAQRGKFYTYIKGKRYNLVYKYVAKTIGGCKLHVLRGYYHLPAYLPLGNPLYLDGKVFGGTVKIHRDYLWAKELKRLSPPAPSPAFSSNDLEGKVLFVHDVGAESPFPWRNKNHLEFARTSVKKGADAHFSRGDLFFLELATGDVGVYTPFRLTDVENGVYYFVGEGVFHSNASCVRARKVLSLSSHRAVLSSNFITLSYDTYREMVGKKGGGDCYVHTVINFLGAKTEVDVVPNHTFFTKMLRFLLREMVSNSEEKEERVVRLVERWTFPSRTLYWEDRFLLTPFTSDRLLASALITSAYISSPQMKEMPSDVRISVEYTPFTREYRIKRAAVEGKEFAVYLSSEKGTERFSIEIPPNTDLLEARCSRAPSRAPQVSSSEDLEDFLSTTLPSHYLLLSAVLQDGTSVEKRFELMAPCEGRERVRFVPEKEGL